ADAPIQRSPLLPMPRLLPPNRPRRKRNQPHRNNVLEEENFLFGWKSQSESHCLAQWLSPFVGLCPVPYSARMDLTDAECIAAVLKGDPASFEPLVKKYSPRVFATARRYARR